jgi:uncharacterized protein (DUF2252 family)
MSEPRFLFDRPSQLHLVDRPEYIQAFQSLTYEERLAAGKAARTQAPRASHADWAPAADRPDPIAILEAQNAGRMPEYVPVRCGRMLATPFAYLRGSAAVMANDLAGTPISGLTVQACGDAHLANFSVFASQERNLVFGIHDFDETLPGPWEWDVKRLATSIMVAGRYLKLGETSCSNAALAALITYRKRMADYAGMGHLELHYTRIDSDAILDALEGRARTAAAQLMAKARQRGHLQVLEKPSELIDGDFRIVEAQPLVVHPSEQMADGRPFVELVHVWLEGYRASLYEERRALLSRYHVADVVMKATGVGSVGLRCYVVLLRGHDQRDPLFLQAKQAQASVLEAHLGPSTYPAHGQRVVAGQRLLQAAPDIFLGWWRYQDPSSDTSFDFYVRQLRQMKATIELAPGTWREESFAQYARLCGWALALAHARSGDPAMIAGYLGNGDRFDDAIVAFAGAYADQTERDYAAFVKAVKEGRMAAETGR